MGQTTLEYQLISLAGSAAPQKVTALLQLPSVSEAIKHSNTILYLFILKVLLMFKNIFYLVSTQISRNCIVWI